MHLLAVIGSCCLLLTVCDAEELQQHLGQSSRQREEIIRLKQELQLLHRDLLLSGTTTATAKNKNKNPKQPFMHQCFLSNCRLHIVFVFCHQERATPGKMSCWSWRAPNRSAPCQSCAAYSRYAVHTCER